MGAEGVTGWAQLWTEHSNALCVLIPSLQLGHSCRPERASDAGVGRYMYCWKAKVEAVRKTSHLSGYEWWLINVRPRPSSQLPSLARKQRPSSCHLAIWPLFPELARTQAS